MYFTILGIILVFALVLILISTLMAFKVIYPNVHPVEETYRDELAKGTFVPEFYTSLSKEEIKIQSSYGYDLHGIYFPMSNSRKYVIICHGITMNTAASIKYMEMFISNSYNILLIDHRHHGKSGGKNTTFGYYEKYDLKAWTDWLTQRFGDEIIIGLHGESMGAAIALQNAPIDPRIRWIVADCPYSDLTKLLSFRISQDYHLPAFPLIPLASLLTRLITGMKFHQVSPIRGLDTLEIPILWIHGKEDWYIPPQMSIDMYNVKKGNKYLYLVPNAKHAESFIQDPGEYKRLVTKFLVDAIKL